MKSSYYLGLMQEYNEKIQLYTEKKEKIDNYVTKLEEASNLNSDLSGLCSSASSLASDVRVSTAGSFDNGELAGLSSSFSSISGGLTSCSAHLKMKSSKYAQDITTYQQKYRGAIQLYNYYLSIGK